MTGYVLDLRLAYPMRYSSSNRLSQPFYLNITLGCVCFDFKSLSEMLFLNAGVWLRMENKFSGNYFQLTGCFESFDLEMV